MENHLTRLTREALYEQVWQEPMAILADRYGISGVGLAKICRRHNVPFPGRGHWARLRAGQRVPRPPLRPGGAQADAEIVIQRHGVAAARAGTVRLPLIEVPADLASPHPEVARALKTLRGSKRDNRGILVPRSSGRLDVRVTRDSLDRALRILDALIKALEEEGHKIQVTAEDPAKTVAVVNGEQVQFSLEEVVLTIETPVDPTRRIEHGLGFFAPSPKISYKPTGDLRLAFQGIAGLGVRHTWADGRRQRLERVVASVLRGFLAAAEGLKAARQQQEERHREWLETQRRWAEEQRVRALHERRVQVLLRQVEDWQRAQAVRAYVSSLRQAGEVRLPADLEISNLDDWMTWALRHAESIDPRGPTPC